MATDVREYVRGCHTCQRNKSSNRHPAGKLQPIAIPHYQWEHATMDRIVGLPKTKKGHTAILVVVDKFSKMTRFAPLRTQATAADIAQAFVEHVWNSHGMPLQITTDRGTEFTNAFSKSLCKMIGTRHTKSTAYHPQTDGQTERMNKVLEDMMRHYITPKMDTWDLMLPVLEFAINHSYQESIQDAPFYLNYGKHPRMPDDIVADKPSKDPRAYNFIKNIERAMTKARSCMRNAQLRQKKYADAYRSELQFNVGDKVWLSSKNIPVKGDIGARKLYPLWIGPFPVTAKVGQVSYQLQIPEHYKMHNTFHVQLLKPVYDNLAGMAAPPTVLVDGEEEYELETILKHRPAEKKQGDTGIQYRVKWVGYGFEHNKWIPQRNFTKRASEILQEYWDGVAMHTPPEPEQGSGAGLAPGTRRSPKIRLIHPISRRSCRRKAAKDCKVKDNLISSLLLQYSSHT